MVLLLLALLLSVLLLRLLCLELLLLVPWAVPPPLCLSHLLPKLASCPLGEALLEPHAQQ
jgi:hypothetical protein